MATSQSVICPGGKSIALPNGGYHSLVVLFCPEWFSAIPVFVFLAFLRLNGFSADKDTIRVVVCE